MLFLFLYLFRTGVRVKGECRTVVAYWASLYLVDLRVDCPMGNSTTDRNTVPRLNQLGMLAQSPFLSSCLKQVPDAIKSQYQFPPPLIAPAAIRDGELICNGIPEESQSHLLNSEHLATQAEQQEVSEGRAEIPNPVFLVSHWSAYWKCCQCLSFLSFPLVPYKLSNPQRTSASDPKGK